MMEFKKPTLREQAVTGPEKLRVLDFDDTIANTTEKVRVETPSGPKMISSKEFAIYELLPGEKIDPELAFTEFNKVDVGSAQPVPFVSDLLKSFTGANGNRKILILTARSQEVEPYVMNFLEKRLGINSPRGKVDFVGVGDKDPMKKVEIIGQYLKSHPTIRFVSFYDDSGKNVKAVKDFLTSIGMKKDVRQVIQDDEGNVSLAQSQEDLPTEEEDTTVKITEIELRNIIRKELLREQEEETEEETEPVKKKKPEKKYDMKDGIFSSKGDPYQYKYDDIAKKMTEKTGKLHFTIHRGPKNKGKTFLLKDTNSPLYKAILRKDPHAKQYS